MNERSFFFADRHAMARKLCHVQCVIALGPYGDCYLEKAGNDFEIQHDSGIHEVGV